MSREEEGAAVVAYFIASSVIPKEIVVARSPCRLRRSGRVEDAREQADDERDEQETAATHGPGG